MTAYKHKSSICADWSKNGRRVLLSCKKDNNKIREPHPLYERIVLVVVFWVARKLTSSSHLKSYQYNKQVDPVYPIF